MIKFMKYYVTNGDCKAKVFYSNAPRVYGRKSVTLYARDYTRNLGRIFDEYINETDSCTDYFEAGRVEFFEDHPFYGQALARCANH